MKALVINCTLKRSPDPSATEALAGVVVERLEKTGEDWRRTAWTSTSSGPSICPPYPAWSAKPCAAGTPGPSSTTSV
jgi:hypothetical protein